MPLEDPLDEIMALVLQAKADLARQVGWEDVAAKEQAKAAQWNLSAAVGAAQQGDYQEALRLFDSLQKILEDGNLLPSEWAEIYLAQAICHARLGNKRAMKRAWKKASQLEPDNDTLRQVAARLGLVKA